MVAFGGWEMPLEFRGGTIAEHMACRQAAAVFDVSHLGTVRLEGTGAFAKLQAELSNDLRRIGPGHAQYTHLLGDDGSVLDDIIVWWVAEQRFDVMPNASNTSGVLEALGGDDVTSGRAVIAVQGPAARSTVAKVLPKAADIGRNAVGQLQWRGGRIVVAGTGYTGEDGLELAVAASGAAVLWEVLVTAGATPAGLGARDTLRLEAGLPLYGHELGPGTSPLEAGLAWVVAWDKPGGFRGRDALLEQRRAGIKKFLRGVVGPGRQPLRVGYEVAIDGVAAGQLTSGNFSPVLGCGIGMCFLPPGVGAGAEVEVGRAATPWHAGYPRCRSCQEAQSRRRSPQRSRPEPAMPNYVPHTEADFARMLADLGLGSIEELFGSVPAALRLAGGLDLPLGMPEADVASSMAALAAANAAPGDLVCFAGGGAYDHDVPAVTRALAGRSEFVTSYTPYQPEVAQGVLQALFEYQTLTCRLAGLPVANASVYDGATAVVEAVNLAVVATGRATVWVSAGLNPRWRSVLATLTAGRAVELVEVPLAGGVTNWRAASSSAPPAALVVASPNYLGCIDPVGSAKAAAQAEGALLICAFDPVSAGLLRTPGEQGADVALAEGQPLGTPLAFGGPYLGMFAVAAAHVRRLPGRLVGRTVDRDGRTAYVTTLRAREQDIRREKASSNICTNQTLIAVAAMVQLAWLGTYGLRELALRCARGTRYLREAVLCLPGARPLVEAPVVREFAVELPLSPEVVVERMADEGFLAGLPVAAEGKEGLLVAVTEKRTRAEMDAYVSALEKVVA